LAVLSLGAALGVVTGACNHEGVPSFVCGGVVSVPEPICDGEVRVEEVCFQRPGEEFPEKPFVLACQPRYVYPEVALRARMHGVVVLSGVVEDSGELSELHVVSSVNPLIDTAARNACRDWRFVAGPTQFVPERALVTITLRFNLL
jgi:TonB family protein